MNTPYINVYQTDYGIIELSDSAASKLKIATEIPYWRKRWGVLSKAERVCMEYEREVNHAASIAYLEGATIKRIK